MAGTIGTAYVQIEPTTQGIAGKLSSALSSEASTAGKAAGGALSSALGTAAKVGVTAIAGATAAVVGFGTSAVSAGQDFDSAMSQVAATMGYSTAELNDSSSEAAKNFQMLRDFAQEMGSTTAFSATEASEALNYMALAGYDAETSMEMLPTVLNLAAAGGIDLASASDMVTDAQSALGLSLEETSVMVDQMAMASSKSNTSVAQLGEAFLTIGANAKNLSGGTQELSTALGILADNGIKGAEGGTHLRNIMLSLNPTTKDAVSAWKQLGVSAYDAEGNLRPLEDTFGDLNKAMEGMTSQEKTDILTKMFNKTDLASINALLATTSDRWDELGTAILNSSDAAQNMANVQLDNLAGDITLFQSALEGAKIAVSDQLTPTLREFVQFGSDGLSQLTQAFNEGGLSGVMEKFGELLGELVNKVIEMLPEMIEAGMELLSALGQGLMDNLPTLVSAAVQIVTMIAKYIVENLPSLIEAAMQIIVELSNGIVQALPELIPVVIDVIFQIVDTLLDNVDMLIDAAIELDIAIANGMVQAIPQIIERIPEIITKLVQAIIRNAPKMVEAGIELVRILGEGILNAITGFLTPVVEAIGNFFTVTIPQQVNLLIEQLQKLPQWFSELPSKIAFSVGAALGEFVTWVYNMGVKALEIAPQVIEKIVSFFKELPTKMRNHLDDAIKNFKQFISDMGTDVKTKIPQLIEDFLNFFRELPDKLKQIGSDIVNGLWEGIKSGWDWLTEQVSGLINSLVEGIKSTLVIGSPSKLMSDEVGQWIPAGIAVGMDSNTDCLEDSMDNIQSSLLSDDFDYSVNYASKGNNNVAQDNTASQIIALLSEYLPMLSNQKVVLDTGATVGALAQPMNVALGKLALRGQMI